MTRAIGVEGKPARTPQRIAVMIGQLGRGGSERQLHMFLAHRDPKAWSPVLYVSGHLGEWAEPIRQTGVPVVLLQGGRWQKLRQLRAACVADGATTFFSWSSYTNAFGLALIGLGMKRIGSFRNAAFADLPEKQRWAWSLLSLAGVQTVVCNSRETCREIARRSHGKRIVYAPNAVQIFSHEQLRAWRQEWRAQLGVPDDTILVLGCGRIVPQKNFVRFVDVIAEVRKKTPIRAIIAGGDHGCLAEVQRRIEERGLQDTVEMLGDVADACELMAAADIFLLTSNEEGMPNVILEAMVAGVPCVTTKVNSIDDLIQDTQSGFVTSFCVEDLARRVTELALDAGLRSRVGTAARANVERCGLEERIAPLWRLCEREKAHPFQANLATIRSGDGRERG